MRISTSQDIDRYVREQPIRDANTPAGCRPDCPPDCYPGFHQWMEEFGAWGEREKAADTSRRPRGYHPLWGWL